jgi:hypothetical protein
MDRTPVNRGIPLECDAAYLIRDRDRIYGSIVTRRMRAMGIRDKPTAPASPWQNGFAERLIGSIRRECVDHFIVLGDAHLRHILRTYARYYNHIRTHWSLDKDTPVHAPFSGSDLSIRTRSWADFTITTFALGFSVHTANSGHLASSSGLRNLSVESHLT